MSVSASLIIEDCIQASDWQDDTANEGTFCQGGQPEFHPRVPCGARKKRLPPVVL